MTVSSVGRDGDSLFERLVALSTEAEETGNHEAAYHLLMAALHVGDRAADIKQVQQVAERALAQERRLEALDPPHPLASAAAQQRGMRPVYRTLQIQVDAVKVRLTAQARLDRIHPQSQD